MVDPMPADPMTDWAKVMGMAGLELPVMPSDPGRWWLQHLVGTAQNMDFPPSDHDDFQWMVHEIAFGAANAENWLSIFACIQPVLHQDEQEQLQMICQAALEVVAERVILSVLRDK